MRVQALAEAFKGRDLYIIGTGPSARLVDWGFFDGKLTLGLNQAWRYRPLDYCLTAHPELVLEYERAKAARSDHAHPTRWLVKQKPPLEKLSLDDPRYYVFRTAEDWSLFERPRPDTLFLGRGIQCTALELAARFGACSATLVGVDMAALGGEHHGHHQHVRPQGVDPDELYREYRLWTAKARRLAWEHRRLPVYQMTPLLGATAAEEDYARLCRQRGLPPLPPPPDTSTRVRAGIDDPGE